MALFLLFLAYQYITTMKKTLLITGLLISFTTLAQQYEWQWATRGGGTKNAQGETASAFDYNSEHIVDIAVDADNNYYYLAFMTQQDTEYAGTPITVYNAENSLSGNTDIVLISTDCEGTLRWTQTVGGADGDFAYNIELDNNGGLYLGANVLNISNGVDNYLPPHFSPDDAMPVVGPNTGGPQEAYKTAALLKYSTQNGSLLWRVMPQGDVSLLLRYAQMHNLQIDSEGNLHALIGFAAGTHLNGQVVVPDSFNNSYKYYIIRFNTDGEVLNVLPLTLEGVLLNNRTSFRYDSASQQYWLAGMRNNGGNSQLVNLSFNGTAFTKQSFMLSFSITGEELWRTEIDADTNFKDNRIHDIEIDSESNVYVAGSYYSGTNWTVTMGSYQFPANISGHRMFIMKLNQAGAVQWVKVPSGYNTPFGIWSGLHFSYDITVNGNEIAIATQVSDEIWDSVSIDRPDNHLDDPGLLRLNKDTGTAIALHDIMTSPGSRDGLSAVAVDSDGNYITGGFFYNDLFTLENDNVPTLTKVGDYESNSDFFIAKLAATPCGTPVANIESNTKNSLKIYPNPATNVITIQQNALSGSYQVINLLGQVLLSGEVTLGETKVSMESLSRGTYIVKVAGTNGTVVSEKIIKE